VRSSGVWALSVRLTCCPGSFWRCRAKALVERFWEITAQSRALSSLCRIARRMVRGRDQRALTSGNKNDDNPRRSPAYREGVNMTTPPCPRAVRPRVAPRRNNVVRPILSCANALYPIAYASPPSTRPIRPKSHRSTTNRPFAAPGRLKLSSTVARSLNRLRLVDQRCQPRVHRPRRRGLMAHGNAPPLRSAGRISSGAARWYHLVAVTPLDLGAMLAADRP
jgi:hypothetical protein